MPGQTSTGIQGLQLGTLGTCFSVWISLNFSQLTNHPKTLSIRNLQNRFFNWKPSTGLLQGLQTSQVRLAMLVALWQMLSWAPLAFHSITTLSNVSRVSLSKISQRGWILHVLTFVRVTTEQPNRWEVCSWNSSSKSIQFVFKSRRLWPSWIRIPDPTPGRWSKTFRVVLD